MNKLEVAVTQQNGIIKMNFDELKVKLKNTLSLYEGTEVTADTTVLAKKDLAELRKVKKSLNDRRIEVKKEFLKPYDDFELKVNELQGMIDKPIETIDSQLKVFEDKRKTEKKKEIQTIYNNLINDLEEYIPLVKIYNDKWENISVTTKSITEEIEQVVSSTEMAVSTIKGMNSEVVDKALEQYKADLSLANAIAYINKHEQIKAEILAKEEQKRKEEAERRRIAEEERIKEQERLKAIEEERKRVAEEQRIRNEEKQRIETEERIRREEREKAEQRLLETSREERQLSVETEEPFSENEPFVEINELPFINSDEIKSVFTIVASQEELRELEMFLVSLGLFYERTDA